MRNGEKFNTDLLAITQPLRINRKAKWKWNQVPNTPVTLFAAGSILNTKHREHCIMSIRVLRLIQSIEISIVCGNIKPLE